jgi:hypothetical protein
LNEEIRPNSKPQQHNKRPATKDVCMKKTLLLVLPIFLLTLFSSSAQVLRHSVFDESVPEEVTYYGIDFSMNQWVESGERKRKSEVFYAKNNKSYFVNAWFNAYHDEIPPGKYLRKWLGLEEGFKFDYNEVMRRNSSADGEWVTDEYSAPDLDQLKATIKSYNLKEKSGTGFVIQAVNYNADEFYSIAIFILFDIATREPMRITEIKTKSEKLGRGGHRAPTFDIIYPMVLVRGTKAFIDKVYKPFLRSKSSK